MRWKQYGAVSATQCTMLCKKVFQPLFSDENNPQLLYVCKINPDVSNRHPRIMHSHDDLVELVLIYTGASKYRSTIRNIPVKAGDLLVYNSGVVHDENSTPDSELGFYTIAIGNLHMPDLRPNALIPDDAGYLFRTGHHFDELKQLFEMMFRNLADGEPYAERFCNSLMHALLDKILSVVNAPTPGIAPEIPEVDEPNILGSRVKNILTNTIQSQLPCNPLRTICTPVHAIYPMFSRI